MQVKGYQKKNKQELLKAIDDCCSIHQIFALVQHEQINMRMQTLPGASNIPPKNVELLAFAPNQTYLDKLKDVVKYTVELSYQ